MITLAEQLGIELSNPAWMHERRNEHGEWTDTPGDAAFPRPEAGKTGSVNRYVVPDPRRLFTKSGYRNPADHPFWKEHPVSPANIVAAYDAVKDEGIRAQGRRWYSDAHMLATKMTGGHPEAGGILLSTYSPKNNWPGNMFNAARSWDQGKPIGPKDGAFVTGAMMAKAQRAIDGEGIDRLMITAKTHSFGALIKYGDDLPEDPYGHVVVDTHAVNVAAGGNLRQGADQGAPIGDVRQHEYIADMYRQAAHDISVRDGVLMKPHQLQAIVWMAQKITNDAQDAWLAEHGEKGQRGAARGRLSLAKNNWAKWIAYAKAHDIPLEGGTTGLAMQALLAQIIDLVGEDAVWVQLDLAFNPLEPRDPHGRWTSGGGHTVNYTGNLGINRADMPQLSGTVHGTYQGSAVMQPKFIEHLRGKGITVTREQVPASQLRPTQTTGDIRVIEGIADSLAQGKQTKPIFVSSDGRVFDGHHTWAAHILAAQRGHSGQETMPVYRVGLPISQLLEEGHAFGQEHGIARRATGEVANPAYASRVAPPADTMAQFRLPDGTWQPGRQALHDQIVAGALAGHQRQAHPVATFLGGGTASGKSTAFGKPSGDQVLIDSDQIKNELPEYPRMVKAGDPKAAAFVHEESSYLAKRIQAEAIARGYHFTLDGTGDSAYEKMLSKIEQARRGGHQVVGKYVTVDTDEAVRRAEQRAAETGRAVPETTIREIHASVSDVLARLIANGDLDAAELWDTNGPRAVKIGEKQLNGTWTVLDQAAWQRFLDKRHEESPV